MAAEFNGYDVDDEEEEDPDFSEDPTYQIDLQAYLTEFLQSLSQQACYSTFSSHHNDSEKHVLRTININRMSTEALCLQSPKNGVNDR
uniref:Importin-9 n=1 Tax=Magallana gigas TaxID=29159 RepID=K1PFS0_MAGGI